MKKALVIFLLLMLSASLGAQDATDARSESVQIEGTGMAQLQSLMDIFKMLPGITVTNNSVIVNGRGTPSIYIGSRKITELSELMHVTADKVKDVEIIRYPGAEYDKNVSSVIVIRLKRDEAEGFSLNNILRLDYTGKFAINDELTLGLKQKALSVTAFVGWDEVRREYEKRKYENKYEDYKLISEEVTVTHPQVHTQRLTARLSAAYDFNAKSRISFNYSFSGKPEDRTWMPETPELDKEPGRRHDFALEYTGKTGEWNFSVGNNSFIDKSDLIEEYSSSSLFYLRNEYDLRTYAKVSGQLGGFTLSAGAEHELDHMDVKLYEEGKSSSPLEMYTGTHALHPDNTIGLFVSGIKEFGRWTIEAGLRYEHHHYVYKPCDDDGLMKFIDDLEPFIDDDLPEKYYLIPLLLKDRQVSYRHNYFYPFLKVSAEFGESKLSLSYTSNTTRPYLGITRLRLSEIELLNEKILMTEQTSAATVEWKYKWAALSAVYTRYSDPICKTISSTDQYNAPDYDAVDFILSLSPKVGIWSPALNARLHKQWFDMPLANGKDRLKTPFANISFDNALTLPKGWFINLNADWHSRGAERNKYWYSPNFQLDASIQKSLSRCGLTFILSAVNILNTSYDDTTSYVKAYYGVSEGIRKPYTRMISLAVRYRL